MMKLGYNTNGLAFHRWPEAIELIAEIGYRSVAITVDHHCLDPYSSRLQDELSQMREILVRLGLISTIETGARYLLNPHLKHEPTLMSATEEERRVRIDFLRVLSAVQEIGYAGGVHVELSRHSHMAPEVMWESFAFLQAILSDLNSGNTSEE